MRRSTTANLRATLGKIMRRAGLKPWPKQFQNLRSTRETELAESFPMHLVCEWIDNSPLVAMKHCLQGTDRRFDGAQQGRRKKRRSKPELRRASR